MTQVSPSVVVLRHQALRHQRAAPSCLQLRRQLLAATLLLAAPSSSAQRAALAPASAPGSSALYTDPDGLFAVLVPAGWEALELSPLSREVLGVYASWRDPGEPSNTLGGA